MTPPTRRRVLVLVALLALATTAVGCSQMSNPTYDLTQSGCSGVPDATLKAIQSKVDSDGFLRNGKQIVQGDDRFVSAELHLHTEGRHHKGDILTWVTSEANGSDFRSVDVNARTNSSWPVAETDVRADGARESRYCTTFDLGKTKAQLACERNSTSNSGVPQLGDRDCGDL